MLRLQIDEKSLCQSDCCVVAVHQPRRRIARAFAVGSSSHVAPSVHAEPATGRLKTVCQAPSPQGRQRRVGLTDRRGPADSRRAPKAIQRRPPRSYMPTPSPLTRPSCQEMSPPRTTPITWRPISFSITARHGTRLKPSPSSIIAKRPLASWVEPTSLPRTVWPSLMDWKVRPCLVASSRPSRSTSEQISSHLQSAFSCSPHVALPDQFVLAQLERLTQLGAEPACGRRAAVTADEFAIEPGRAITRYLPVEVVGAKDPQAGLTPLSGIVGGRAIFEVLGDEPAIGIGPFNNAGAAQSFQAPHMSVHVGVIVPAGDTELGGLGKCAVLA